MTLAQFNELWASKSYPPERVSEADFDALEQRLGVHLPADYRQAVLQVGLPRPTLGLMDAITERELDLPSLSDLYSPAEIIEETISWRGIGMPEQLVAFASDGCGNKFCFDADRLNRGSADGNAIWFYDHDFEAVEEIAPSFTVWIEAFCHVKPLGAADAS